MYKGRDILSKYSTHCGRQSCFPFYNLATFDKKTQTNPQKNKIDRVGNSNICARSWSSFTNTVKPAHVVLSIKQSPVFKSHLFVPCHMNCHLFY
jgi:hypothetical protein